MFQHFTERARKVMALANQEAQRFNHDYIGSEHILLGLVKEGSGVGANVLKNLGVDLAILRHEVEKLTKSGPEGSPMGPPAQTPSAKKVIEYAIEEARNLNHNYFGSEHLLLGLLRVHDGVAAQALTNLGVTLEEVRMEVLALLGTGGPGHEGGEGPNASAGNPGMIERFSDRAGKVMALADKEAKHFNHEYIGTEHILLGLLREGSGTGVSVLKNLNIDLRKVRLEVERLAKPGPEMVTMGHLPQTPRAKQAIAYAIDEAQNLNHKHVGTEHLLLGLLREHDGIAAQVLMSLGLTLDRVRAEVLALLGAGGVRPKARASSAGMFDRFTDRARKVLAFANEEASRFDHEYIGTEHILLGIAKEGSGTGASVLKNLNLDPPKIRLEVERLLKPGPEMVFKGRLPMTPRVKKVIEYAIEEAQDFGHDYVGTEHLILGLMRELDGIAAQVFIRLGLSLEAMRKEVLRVLATKKPQAATSDDAANAVLLADSPAPVRRVMMQADQLAQSFGHDKIGVEHLLLALLDNPAGEAMAVWKVLSVDLPKLRFDVHRIMRPATKEQFSRPRHTTTEAIQALAYAAMSVSELGHRRLGAEHFLLGIVFSPCRSIQDSIPARGPNANARADARTLLDVLGVHALTPDRVRAAIVAVHAFDKSDSPDFPRHESVESDPVPTPDPHSLVPLPPTVKAPAAIILLVCLAAFLGALVGILILSWH